MTHGSNAAEALPARLHVSKTNKQAVATKESHTTVAQHMLQMLKHYHVSTCGGSVAPFTML